MPSNHYLNEFDGAANANVAAHIVAIPQTGSFLYVPEVTHSSITPGECPYYAVNVRYMPTQVVYQVEWIPASMPNTVLTADDIQASRFSDMDYVLLRREINGGVRGHLPDGTIFKTLDLLRQAAWLATYGSGLGNGGWTGSTTQIGEANAIIGNAPPAVPTYSQLLSSPSELFGYLVYTGASSWYCLPLGGVLNSSGGGPTPVYAIPRWGAVRGVAYDTNIADFKGPGLPYAWMMDANRSGDPVETMTHVTTVVRILDWAHATQSGIAN
jgi:hypothetical protein